MATPPPPRRRAARRILRDPLPLKCVEATFLALLLTCGWRGADRVALGFKSRAAGGAPHRHIVLAVRDGGGAPGSDGRW